MPRPVTTDSRPATSGHAQLNGRTFVPIPQVAALPLAKSSVQSRLGRLDMPTDISSDELRSLRQAAGLDLAVLARRVSLSAAQLKQLECGQDSLFYSPAIRHQAALKVQQYLDAQLQSPAADRSA